MNTDTNHRSVLLACVLLLIFAGSCGLWAGIEKRQYTLDRQLIEALVQYDTRQAIALVKAGADPNARYEVNMTSLQEFIDRSLDRLPPYVNTSPTAFMMACGAYWTDANGRLTWMRSVSPPLLQTMVRHGADFRIKDSYGRTAINYAGKSILMPAALPAFMQETDTNDLGTLPSGMMQKQHLKYKVSANKISLAAVLLAAAAAGNDNQVRSLLVLGALVDAQDDGGSALVYAAKKGHLSTVKLLLGAGAHLDACDKESEYLGGDYNQALYWASANGYTRIARLLLHHGAKMNGQDSTGYGPLLAAVDASHWEIARMLLVSGANPNFHTSHSLESALMIASRQGALDTVKILLKYGADPEVKDKYGHAAVWFALDHKYYFIARFLSNYCKRS